MFRLFLLAFTIIAFTASANAPVKSAFDGTWEYTAQGAPEGYQSGTITIKDTELEVMIGGYQKVTGRDVKIEKNKLTCYTYVEGSRVDITLTMKDGIVSGTANTEEGSLPVTLKKKK